MRLFNRQKTVPYPVNSFYVSRIFPAVLQFAANIRHDTSYILSSVIIVQPDRGTDLLRRQHNACISRHKRQQPEFLLQQVDLISGLCHLMARGVYHQVSAIQDNCAGPEVIVLAEAFVSADLTHDG